MFRLQVSWRIFHQTLEPSDQDEYNSMFDHHHSYSLKNPEGNLLYSHDKSQNTKDSSLHHESHSDNIFTSSSDIENEETINSTQPMNESYSNSNSLSSIGRGLPGGSSENMVSSDLHSEQTKPEITIPMEEEPLTVHPESDHDSSSIIVLRNEY